MSVVPIDRSLSVLDGRHELRVQTVTLSDEYFEVAYTISPPLPEGPEDMVLPRIEATDDSGRSYDDSGGAYGVSDDGARTEGTITGQPGFPPDARQVALRFVLTQRGSETVHEIPLVLP